jgi:hypothetical protein
MITTIQESKYRFDRMKVNSKITSVGKAIQARIDSGARDDDIELATLRDHTTYLLGVLDTIDSYMLAVGIDRIINREHIERLLIKSSE